MKLPRQCERNVMNKNYRKMQKNQFKTTFPRNKKQSLLYTLYLLSRYKEIHLNTSASDDKKLLKDAKNPTSFN